MASAVVGVSQFILDRHLQLQSFSRVPRRKVIPNAFVERLPRTARRPDPGGPLQLGYLGRLAPSKGVDLVIESLRRHGSPSVRLSVAGSAGADKAYARQFKALCDGLDVRFLGLTNPKTFFASIDALVVPSLWDEPFARVIVEAFAAGLPVIAARRGGVPEIVEEGETPTKGMLRPPLSLIPRPTFFY